MKIRIASLQVLALLAAGCGNSNAAAPWLTMPDATAHTRYFPIGPGSIHAGADCNKCHSDAAGQPSASFTTFNCAGCHDVVVGGTALHGDAVTLASLHPPATAFTNTVATLGLSDACRSCHPDGGVSAPANHEQLFPRAAGTKHASLTCSGCHTDPANRNDVTKLACASCHLARDATLTAKHGTVGGVAILTVHTGQNTTGPPLTMTSPDCVRCHADSQVNRVSSHSRGDSGFSRPEHDGAGCVTCHSADRPPSEKPYRAVNWRTHPGCTTCHPGGIPN